MISLNIICENFSTTIENCTSITDLKELKEIVESENISKIIELFEHFNKQHNKGTEDYYKRLFIFMEKT